MEKGTEAKSMEIISQLTDLENNKEVKEVQLTNPLQDLGNEILDFFNKTLDHVAKLEDFKDELRQALKDKMKTDPTITFSQLSNLFINLTEQKSLASEQIISLLRPTQNSTINPFTTSINKENNKNQHEDTVYDSKTQSKIDTIYRILLGEDKK